MAGKKRVSVPLAEKKRYCEMIRKGASRSTVSEFFARNMERSTMWPILFWKKKRRNHLSSTFVLFKLIMRKLERKWTFKNKLLFKFPRKKRPKPRKNNSKSRAFSNNCCNFFPKINSQRKTGINLENFWMTDFCFFSQNRHKFGRHKFGT
jgi:hypothetical protein